MMKFPSWMPKHLYRFGSYSLWEGWQAYSGHDPYGPIRMFQWEAIADLPDEFVRISSRPGYFETFEPYRVQLIPRR